MVVVLVGGGQGRVMHKDPNNSSQDIFFYSPLFMLHTPFFPGSRRRRWRRKRGRRRGRRAGLSNEAGSLDSGG